MSTKKRLGVEDAAISQRTLVYSALGLCRLGLVAMLTIGISGCGTKTELLKPDGKPTPRDERDPSQPPSPISR